MTKIERLLCKLHVHKWTPWESVNIPLKPVSTDHMIFGTSDLMLETKSRCCVRCRKGEVKEVFHW